ncbi:MAG TPA: prepilin-type N-terminal cleavage/methylation domain-containing protein [Patescibacteria group bacterium]|nr:prepilin-type N-terminal cleavage/methylation domain-containing protein [Patescibacteria group bacterium]
MLRSSRQQKEAGFTLPELVIVLVVIGVVTTTMFTFVTSSLKRYVALQAESSSFGQLAKQSQRLAQVLRGTTDITVANTEDITAYAYFYPNDAYVSLIHYYKNPANTQLFADVTPMTANPPIGTPINASKKTFTIIDNFYTVAGVQTFTYLDSVGNVLNTPISDLHTIKGIKVSLATPGDSVTKNSSDTIVLQVSLRNRKTNL